MCMRLYDPLWPVLQSATRQLCLLLASGLAARWSNWHFSLELLEHDKQCRIAWRCCQHVRDTAPSWKLLAYDNQNLPISITHILPVLLIGQVATLRPFFCASSIWLCASLACLMQITRAVHLSWLENDSGILRWNIETKKHWTDSWNSKHIFDGLWRLITYFQSHYNLRVRSPAFPSLLPSYCSCMSNLDEASTSSATKSMRQQPLRPPADSVWNHSEWILGCSLYSCNMFLYFIYLHVAILHFLDASPSHPQLWRQPARTIKRGGNLFQ